MKHKKGETFDQNQHREFVKAARELGCDDSESTFDRMLGKIASAPPPKSVQKRKPKRVKSAGKRS